MKKPVSKKAAPKTQKVDLDCLNFCAVASLILVFAFGIGSLVALSVISDNVRDVRDNLNSVRHDVGEIRYSSASSNRKLQFIDDSLDKIEHVINKKAGKK